MVEFGIYLPQLALDYDTLLDRALAVEALGYDSFWMYDHLTAPGMPDAPSFEAWTAATALLAQTTRLRVGHLVLCNNFRHPALLAKMATSLDVISGGRLELGLGSGSIEAEHLEAGLPWGTMRERSERFGEALEIITRMFAAPRTTFEGKYYSVHDLANVPPPVQQPRPPIHIGGAGPKLTLPLVAKYADAWNVPTYALDRMKELNHALDEECEKIGRDPATIRRSIESVLVVAPAAGLDDALALAHRRFGGEGFGLEAGGFMGTPAQITDRVGELMEVGFSSFVFFTHDRAKDATLQLFAEEVMCHFRPLPG
jgi:F420-dependent oxidoreductase-like protein